MGVGIGPVSQRMVCTNMVDQSLLCRRSVAPKQRCENFAMLQYRLNERIAIQTLIVEQDAVIRAVTIKEIGNVGILRLFD